MAGQKVFWKTFLWANWIIILWFWMQGSQDLWSQGTAGVLIALGKIAGLAGAYCVLQQFFFMGRMPWLERVFGLDRLSRLHQKNGKLGLTFIVVHPVLLVLGYSMFSSTGVVAQFMGLMRSSDEFFKALIGFILFFIVVGISIRIVRARLRYESWYYVHLVAYLAVFFSFGHQFEHGSDLLANRFFYGYWTVLYIGVFASHLVFRFVRPVYLYFRHDFTVARVERESPSAVSVYIVGRAIDQFKIQPGQFMIVRFFKKGLWWQAHPFSLSMMPNGKEIRITVREVGDFTGQLKNLTQGTSLMIDGPYGVFTDLFGVSSKALFIAGGIGITPIRSLMEEMLKKGKDVILLYGNRTNKDIVFKTELASMSAQYGGSITYVISHEKEGYQGETGHIDQEKLARLVPDLKERDVYLCGPVPMMDGVLKALRLLGIPMKNVHYEKFSF